MCKLVPRNGRSADRIRRLCTGNHLPGKRSIANPDKHTLKEAQDWSDRIYHISQAIYGGGQPSGEAHARLKEALYQRGIFSNALMRKPVLPLNQEEKDWVSLGLERSQLPKVDMNNTNKEGSEKEVALWKTRQQKYLGQMLNGFH